MSQFPDALRSADEEISQRTENLEDGDEDNPHHFGIIGGGFVFDATNQGCDPKNRAYQKKESDNHPFGAVRQAEGEYRMGEQRVHDSMISWQTGFDKLGMTECR